MPQECRRRLLYVHSKRSARQYRRIHLTMRTIGTLRAIRTTIAQAVEKYSGFMTPRHRTSPRFLEA